MLSQKPTLTQAESNIEFIEEICHILDKNGNRQFLHLLAEET